MSKKDDDDSLWDYIKRTVTPLRGESADGSPVGDDDDFAALLDGENKTSNRRNEKTRATGADQTGTPSEKSDQKTADQKTADEIKADTPAPSRSAPQSVSQNSGAQGRTSAGVSGEVLGGMPGGMSGAVSESVSATGGLDRRTAQRLTRGQLPIEARLDLHGMRQTEAHTALNRFIAQSYGSGKRCVLVITGKGKKKFDLGRFYHDDPDDHFTGEHTSRPGVLRENVPQWLSRPPNGHLVLRTAPARPKDGGDGALYVYLRRKKN